MPRTKGRLTLPVTPNLEFLRNQAKERLDIIRTHAPDAQLSDAQFALARDYGFSSWQALHAEVQKKTDSLSIYKGFYRYDPALIANMAFDVTVKDGRLVVGRSNAARYEVTPQGEDAFLSPGVSTVYRFEKDADGRVIAMLVETEGRIQRASRIDAAIMGEIEAAYKRALEEESRQRTVIRLPPEVLQPYVGKYASAFGHVMDVVHEDNRLFLQVLGQARLPLDAETATDFFLSIAPLWIHFQVANGEVTGFERHQSGVVTFMRRVSPEEAAKAGEAAMRRLREQQQPRHVVAIDAALLPRYAGRYRVSPKREMVVSVEGSHLYAQITAQPRFEIHPEASDKFFFTAVAAQLKFFFNSSGKVSHAVLHQAGHLLPLGRIDSENRPVPEDKKWRNAS